MKSKLTNSKKITKLILGILCSLTIVFTSVGNQVFAANSEQIPENTSVSRGTGVAPEIYKSTTTLIKETQNSSLSSTEKEVQLNILNTRKNNAITQSNIDSLFTSSIPAMIDAVSDNPTHYGFDYSQLKNAYLGESFGCLIWENDYVTDDDTVLYYPICYDRQIIGLVTLTKSNVGFTISVEKSFADKLTNLLITVNGGNVVLLKKVDTIYAAIDGGIAVLAASATTPTQIPTVDYDDVSGAKINTVNAEILTETYNLDGEKISYTPTAVNSFVMRLYEKALERTATNSEIAYWADQLTNRTNNGADVAYGFIFSDEFLDMDLNDKLFLDTLYSTMFDRSADSEGKANWLRLLSNGLSREYVFKGFVESQEFTKLCASYSINRGSITLYEARDQNPGVTMFVYRCYNIALGRSADINGLNNWCWQLISLNNTPYSVAYGFIFSQEMKNKNLSNTEFTKVLYRVFLDREYDVYGLNDWVGKLDRGVSREEIFKGFAGSQEFSKLVVSYGFSS